MSNAFPKLHNAMWPGLVGKGDGPGEEPAISLDRMLNLTTAATRDGRTFDGVDLFLQPPHIDPAASEGELRSVATAIAERGLAIGSLVAPVWPGAGGGSAMGDSAARRRFLDAIENACRAAQVFDASGVRASGVIRIDSAEFGVDAWRQAPVENTKRIAETFREAGKIAADAGQRLAAEGEICWAGMHSWRDMLDLLEETDMPRVVGFQADLAHTYLYLLGYNAPQHALVGAAPTEEEFYSAYGDMVAKLRPWTTDLHIAQNDGRVKGAGDHDKTGKHCPPDDANGKLDIARCAAYWLEGAGERGIRHICWDGCMFPNEVMEAPQTWDAVLAAMTRVREAHGWN
ncbi:MAG: TIM barrel protein [Planctomycetota bacterium]